MPPEERMSRARPGQGDVIAGEPLGVGGRPASDQLLADEAASVSVEVGFADEGGDARPVGRRARVGDEDGALALAQVADRGLAGLRLVAEHAEQVVDELVGDPDLAAEVAERWRCRQRMHRPG